MNQKIKDGMRIAKLRGIHEELYSYRSYSPEHPSGNPKSGGVLPFVKGLYLAARVIYFIREVLNAHVLEAHWGHVIHESEIYFSPECDIILHKPCPRTVWNGNVMDFHFIEASYVCAVISCKSLVTSIEEKYCADLKSFGINKVGLIGESCSKTNYLNLRNKAMDAGYENFWSLGVEIDGTREVDEALHLDFIRFLENLQ